jgi:hypothetical protein
MKTLSDVAKVIKEKAQSLIKDGYPGWKKAKSSPRPAPYVSGNLYRSIGSFNNDQRMVFTQKGKSFITLNYAPPEARYGESVEEGKGNSSGVGPKPFAELSANSSEVKKAIAQFQQSEILAINTDVKKRVTTIFQSLQNI